jgi:hypothetical protein
LPENAKDVVIAALGGAVALAGLLLVFSGFVFSQAASFPPETTDDKTIRRYELAAKLGVIPFLIALGDAALGFGWLINGATCLYKGSVWGFFLLLALTALYGVWLILFYL